MKNLQTKTKAQLIEMLQAEKPTGNLDEFCKLLKQHVEGYQKGMFSKVEIYQIINKVYQAYTWVESNEVRKDEED